MIVHIINNIPSPYRSILFREIKKNESRYNCKVSFYYLSSSESVRNWAPATLSDSESILPVLFQRRNKMTTTSDFIINYGYLRELFLADVSIFFGYSYLTYLITSAVRIFFKKRNILFCESTRLDSPPKTMKSFIKKFIIKFLFSEYIVPGRESFDYLIENGVNPKSIFFAHNSSDLRPENYQLSVSPSGYPLRLLFVGRLAKEKNLTSIIMLLKTSNINFRFNIVGEGPESFRLKSIISDDSRFYLHGHFDSEELKNMYINSDILILPSRSEPWGLVINEAINFGLAVIVSNRVGCRHELVDGNGVVFNPEKEGDFMLALNTTIENLPQFKRKSLILSKKFTSTNQAISFLSVV